MRRWLTGALFVLSALVLTASVVLPGYRNREEGIAGALGAGFGRLLAVVVIALILRYGYVRLVATRTPVTGPWLLVVAAAVSFVLLIGGVIGDQEETRQAVKDASSRTGKCRRSQGGPFRPLPEGLRYQDLSAEEREAFAEQVPPALSGAYEIKRVLEGKAIVAVVIAARVAGEQADARRGFVERAREEGTALKSLELGGQRVLYGRLAGELVAAGETPCDFLIITAADLGTLKFVGAPLLER